MRPVTGPTIEEEAGTETSAQGTRSAVLGRLNKEGMEFQDMSIFGGPSSLE